MTTEHIKTFQKIIHDFYTLNKRDFLWREDISPYKIFVSEIMLQQTQTARVEPKFAAWLQKFPDFKSLASASKEQVLSAWQGLGYNRRGLALHSGAQRIVSEFNGCLPDSEQALQTFVGIGPNTAASICAFAFNKPVVFIETNIRTVFLHHFFSEQTDVDDKQILQLVAASLDKQNPRDWYYGLMDYGVYLKKEFKANNKRSRHFIKQSKFIGSRRQVRGAIVRILTQVKRLSHDELGELVKQEIPYSVHDVDIVLQQLIGEGLVQQHDEHYYL
ncbi:MAG: A/G-specific adenine glycosylase [Candidatus Dependentiae bacterium]|nr:A/G-specific adenine glycosylase [Candidatus Dependentiae bacterium]